MEVIDLGGIESDKGRKIKFRTEVANYSLAIYQLLELIMQKVNMHGGRLVHYLECYHVT